MVSETYNTDRGPFKRVPAKEVFASMVVWGAAISVAAAFTWIVGDLLWHGLPRFSWAFLTAEPLDAGRGGGIAPMIVSSLLILVVCLVVAIPIGLGTAVLLAEFTPDRGRFGWLVRRSLDVLAGVPSIVFGLFGGLFFVEVLGLGYSILAGGLTLACMVLPIFIRAAEVGFRSVDDAHRLASAALGMTRTTTLVKVLLPLAMPGLVVGLVLGIGRALAETAALLLTSGSVDRMPESLTDSGRALSIHIYELASNIPGGQEAAYGSAVVLVMMLLGINLIAGLISHRLLRRGVVAV